VTKQEFINELEEKLKGLPKKESADRVTFYSEMIDDRVEDGLTEQEAVMEIGEIDDIVKQLINEIPLGKIAKESLTKKRSLHTWEIILLILGFPVWLPLLISAVAVVLSLYVSIWAVVISLWAVFASLASCGLAGIFAGIVITFTSGFTPGVFLLSLSLFSLGASIFSFFGCKEATRGTILLTKVIISGIKKSLIKKGAAR